MGRPVITNLRTWPRNLSTSQGGGLSTSQGGGMSTSSSNIYKSNIPPWPFFVKELEKRGYDRAVETIKNCLPINLWPENYFYLEKSLIKASAKHCKKNKAKTCRIESPSSLATPDCPTDTQTLQPALLLNLRLGKI